MTSAISLIRRHRRLPGLLARLRPGPAGTWALGGTAVFLMASLLSGTRISLSVEAYLPMHILMELFSILVGAMIFVLTWESRAHRSARDLFLGSAFLAVALLDLGHMLSYQGMPVLVTPSDPGKAIHFWLGARTVAGIALLALALGWPTERSPRALTLAMLPALLGVVALVYWTGLWHLDAMPATFVPGEGLTPFKVAYEHGLALLYAAAALLFVLSSRDGGNGDRAWLATAAWLLALAELFFTLYAGVTDLFNILGHVYKVLAYVLIYRVLVVRLIATPFARVEQERHLLRRVYSALPDLAWLKDREGVYLACNPAFERYFGASEQTIVGHSDYDFVDRETADFFRHHDAEAQHGTHVNEEWLNFPDGRCLLVETIKAPVRDDDGTVLGILGVSRDITERKSSEVRLQANERRLSLAMGGADIGIWDWNLRTGELVVSGRWEATLGYAPEELAPHVRALDHLVHPADRERLHAARQAHLDGEHDGYESEHRLRARDGSWIWVLERGAVTERDRAGKALSVSGTYLDITARKNAEARLQERDELLSRLSRQVPGTIYQCRRDPRGHISMPYASEGLREMFAISPSEVRDDAAPALGRIHPDDLEGFLAGLQESAEALAPWREEFRVVLPEAGVRWREGHALPQRLADGSVLWHGYITDLGPRKQAEEHLRLAASVFSHTHDGIAITDAEATIVDVNPTFSRITGYRREEAVGQNPRLLKSGFHGTDFYVGMWRDLRDKGYWRGEIWNRRKNGETYPELLAISAVEDARGQVTHYVAVFSDITEIKQHQARLEQLAHYDALTHLPNRLLLADRLQLALAQANRNRTLLAIGYLDLDEFKPVNDTYGHEAGDHLLREVARRLQRVVRAGDTVARLGGDEFVVLLNGLGDLTECHKILERMLAIVSEPFTVGDHSLEVSASAGVTIYPNDAADADTLVRHADQAMYQAKQAGRHRYQLFDPNHERQARVYRAAMSRVRAAVESRELRLHYQPQVDMRRGTVVGAEALVRWQHPQRGLLAPGEFLHYVDSADLCAALGTWVMDEALSQLEDWWSRDLPLCVSVNISARHLQQAGFVDQLAGLLAAHPEVPPAAFVLEVLETAALEDLDQVGALVEACRALGVGFSLDDFGTGYSSLTYLKRLHANELKIDQSFVRDMLDDPSDLAIVEGVIGLANAFQRRVIAEGVETEDHGVLLMQLGCDRAQGYGIARPMPPAALPDWVAGWAQPAAWVEAAATHWSPPDFPLLTAEMDHRRWIADLRAAAANGADSLPALEPHLCRFGRWYETTGRRAYGDLEDFRKVGELHARTHRLGADVLSLARAGGIAAAGPQLAELEAIQQEMGVLLRALKEAAGTPD